MTKQYIQIDLILSMMWSSNNVLSKYKIYTNLHTVIYNCSWHFRVHLQYVRHCKWFFAHLQFLHFAVLQLQTATAICKLPSTFDVHCSIKLSFLFTSHKAVISPTVSKEADETILSIPEPMIIFPIHTRPACSRWSPPMKQK